MLIYANLLAALYLNRIRTNFSEAFNLKVWLPGEFGPVNFNVRLQRCQYRLHFVFSRSFENVLPLPLIGDAGTLRRKQTNATHIIIRDARQWCFQKYEHSYNCSPFRCKLLWSRAHWKIYFLKSLYASQKFHGHQKIRIFIFDSSWLHNIFKHM